MRIQILVTTIETNLGRNSSRLLDDRTSAIYILYTLYVT